MLTRLYVPPGNVLQAWNNHPKRLAVPADRVLRISSPPKGYLHLLVDEKSFDLMCLHKRLPLFTSTDEELRDAGYLGSISFASVWTDAYLPEEAKFLSNSWWVG